MRINSEGQVTIPQHVRESMGIFPEETEIDFYQDENGNWYIEKVETAPQQLNRFRTAYSLGKPILSTDEIMALTRGDA